MLVIYLYSFFYILQGMQYFIPVKEHRTTKINTNNKNEQIRELLKMLFIKQLDEFRASYFGHFTHLRPFKILYQLIHNLLLGQLKQPTLLKSRLILLGQNFVLAYVNLRLSLVWVALVL